MKTNITEYLRINFETEKWECRRCDTELIGARENYKRGLLVYDRDPRDIHKPLIDANVYDYSFAPDPAYTALLEYYCPHCGTMIETEYTVPGHPPVHDIELDIDSLRSKVSAWGDVPEQPDIPDTELIRHIHNH
ncbi:MAG: acetone carboxylase subunit gamma [Gammaproteobacteria bacterium]|nr:MAG: acetone carboxylase subunit gamma [Gammaproteobacteria bacterium]